MKKRILSICALLLCAVLITAATGCDAHTHTYRQTVIQPTCNSIGYTVNTCSCGETYYSDYLPETAHAFGEWIADLEPTLIAGGEEYRTCSSCGILQRREVENLSALPELYLEGTADGKETVSLRYAAGEDLLVVCGALVKQRTDPNGGKHLYDLQLVAEGTGNAYYADLGWGEQDRYLLSPQALDPTYTRTAAAQTLWNTCLARHIGGQTPEWEAASLDTYIHTNTSVVVQLYRNGSYLGLYLLSLPRNARIGMGNSKSAALRAEDESDGCLFLDTPTYAEGTSAKGFSFLECSDANTTWITDNFDAFSEFVRRSPDPVFIEGLSQYTDPEVLIDYYLLLQFFGAPRGDTVGTVWYTTDLYHWLPSFDEYQISFGLKAGGSLMEDPAEGIPVPNENGTVSYGGQNQLWERLLQLFPTEISERYRTLKQTVLNPDALFDVFLAQYGQIEPGLFELEAALSPAPEGTEDLEKIQTFLQDRLQAMDRWVQALTFIPEEP